MESNWLKLSKDKRIDTLNQASQITGLPSQAIEKDWWVSLCLKACFSLDFQDALVFKGGTSLSKAWNLIERFSEDIDLALDRKLLGFNGEISKAQIKKLRKKSCEFISFEFREKLEHQLDLSGAKQYCSVIAQNPLDSDQDPQTIEIHYQSALESIEYIPQRVLVEVSSRSLFEPSEIRPVNSILSTCFENSSFYTDNFHLSAVLPTRTFLEKVFLLHEAFSKPDGDPKTARISRHYYDLDILSNSVYFEKALEDYELYNTIIHHREKFNAIKGLDYSKHAAPFIKIVPPEKYLSAIEKDYSEMVRFMIFGETKSFKALMTQIEYIQEKINNLEPHQ